MSIFVSFESTAMLSQLNPEVHQSILDWGMYNNKNHVDGMRGKVKQQKLNANITPLFKMEYSYLHDINEVQEQTWFIPSYSNAHQKFLKCT